MNDYNLKINNTTQEYFQNEQNMNKPESSSQTSLYTNVNFPSIQFLTSQGNLINTPLPDVKQHLKGQMPNPDIGRQFQQQDVAISKTSTFNAVVTHINEEFGGFIGPDIFFQLSSVSGKSKLKVGDEVSFETDSVEGMPFKWKGKNVELISKNILIEKNPTPTCSISPINPSSVSMAKQVSSTLTNAELNMDNETNYGFFGKALLFCKNLEINANMDTTYRNSANNCIERKIKRMSEELKKNKIKGNEVTVTTPIPITPHFNLFETKQKKETVRNLELSTNKCLSTKVTKSTSSDISTTQNLEPNLISLNQIPTNQADEENNKKQTLATTIILSNNMKAIPIPVHIKQNNLPCEKETVRNLELSANKLLSTKVTKSTCSDVSTAQNVQPNLIELKRIRTIQLIEENHKKQASASTIILSNNKKAIPIPVHIKQNNLPCNQLTNLTNEIIPNLSEESIKISIGVINDDKKLAKLERQRNINDIIERNEIIRLKRLNSKSILIKRNGLYESRYKSPKFSSYSSVPQYFNLEGNTGNNYYEKPIGWPPFVERVPENDPQYFSPDTNNFKCYSTGFNIAPNNLFYKNEKYHEDVSYTNSFESIKVNQKTNWQSCKKFDHHENICRDRIEFCQICRKKGHSESICRHRIKVCQFCKKNGHSESICRDRIKVCKICKKKGHSETTCWYRTIPLTV